MYEKSLEIRHFRVFPYSKEAELVPSWPFGVARDGTDEETAPTEASGSILVGGREGKMEIFVDTARKIR